ncbi:unnamed protein product [Brachionus calyciflorus]|uniref:Uncharacterized protein n=1 Tax=Brachionus calyciflorus TaxID=104777 RepID=A0A813ML31_9BILA|nr:unnamed protein product [Brachionus calyciflorus]
MLMTVFLMISCLISVNISLIFFKCPYESCLTVQNGNSCSVDCYSEDGNFPKIGENKSKIITQMVLKNVTFIPDDAFKDLEITSLIIDAEVLQNVSENAFRNVKKIPILKIPNLKSPQVLPKNTFEPLKNSTGTISMENMKLEEISVYEFLNYLKSLQNLKVVNLNENSLRNLSYDFNEFFKLEKINLSKNLIENFSIRGKIHSFMLSSNKIKDLKQVMFQNLEFLYFLDLSHNYIEKIEQNIFSNLGHLHTLILNNNRIRLLEEDWISLSNSLITLDLSNNLIETLSIQNLINLKYLYVSGNRIKVINYPKNELYFLDISNNSLVNVPDKFHEIVEFCQTINLSRNKIKNIEFLEKNNFPNLTNLFLSRNEIVHFKIENFKNVKEISLLDISFNFIQEIEFLPMENLKILNLKNNYLRYLSRSSLINLVNLEQFYAANNNLILIDSSSFNNNKLLKNLNLSNNYLNKIPNISKLDKLEILDCSNQNGQLTELSNYAFEKELTNDESKSRSLAIEIEYNNITNFNDKIFCSRYSNSIDLNIVKISIDDIDQMDKCILKQLQFVKEVIIRVRKSKQCPIITNYKDKLYKNLYCNLKDLTADCYDSSKEKFLCEIYTDRGMKKFFTWISGDFHMYSFDNLHEQCDIEGEHLCFSFSNLNIYCMFNSELNLKSIRVIFTSKKNYTYIADQENFSTQFLNQKSEINIGKINSSINILKGVKDQIIINDYLNDIEIHIHKSDLFYSLMLKSSKNIFSRSIGLLKSGCLKSSIIKPRFIGREQKNTILQMAKNLKVQFEAEKEFIDLLSNTEIITNRTWSSEIFNTTASSLILYNNTLQENNSIQQILENVFTNKSEYFTPAESTTKLFNNFSKSEMNETIETLPESLRNCSDCFITMIVESDPDNKCLHIIYHPKRKICLMLRKSTTKNWEILENNISSTLTTLIINQEISTDSVPEVNDETTLTSFVPITSRRRPNFTLAFNKATSSAKITLPKFENNKTDETLISNNSNKYQTIDSIRLENENNQSNETVTTISKSNSKKHVTKIVMAPFATIYSSTSSYTCSSSIILSNGFYIFLINFILFVSYF